MPPDTPGTETVMATATAAIAHGAMRDTRHRFASVDIIPLRDLDQVGL